MSDESDRDLAGVEVQRKAEWSSEPALNPTELEEILDNHKLGSTWTAATALSYGAKIIPATRNGHIYRVITAGATGSTEPTWPTGFEEEVTDGTVTFEEYGEFEGNIYNIRGAVHEAWMLKASKAAPAFMDGLEKVFEHCERQAERYRTVLIG